MKTVDIRGWEVRRRGLVALHAPWSIDFGAAYFYGYKEPWNLPRGKILAVAKISEVFDLGGRQSLELLEHHRQPVPSGGGDYGVRFCSIQPLQRPVRCRGRRMLFPLPPDVARRIEHELNLGQ